MLVEFLHDIMKQQTSLSVIDLSPLHKVRHDFQRQTESFFKTNNNTFSSKSKVLGTLEYIREVIGILHLIHQCLFRESSRFVNLVPQY